MKQQSALSKVLYQAGQTYDPGFYGAFAMNNMRLEMGYRAWGVDLTSERTHLEYGLSKFVNTVDRDFIGCERMLARSQAANHWQMVALAFEDSEIDPFYSHTVLPNNEALGLVTSKAYGHRLEHALGLAYFKQKVEPDDGLSVSILGRSVRAYIRNL